MCVNQIWIVQILCIVVTADHGETIYVFKTSNKEASFVIVLFKKFHLLHVPFPFVSFKFMAYFIQLLLSFTCIIVIST